MDAHHFALRHREHAERVFLAQVFLGGVRELGQIRQFPQIRGMDPGLIKLALVQRHVVVGVGHRVLQPGQLQGLEFVAAHELRGIQL